MLMRRFATLLGIFLLIEGTWGLFSPVVFGVLSTNTTHAVIHILLGVIGIWTGRSDNARPYLMFVGALLILVGVLFFVPGASALVVSILNVNRAVAFFNITVGVICLALALSAPRAGRVVT